MVAPLPRAGAGGLPHSASHPDSKPPMNEDGHVSNSRRGLLAAGLAAAVVGSMGIVWTLSADAGEMPEGGTAVVASEPAQPPAGEPVTEPAGEPVTEPAEGPVAAP